MTIQWDKFQTAVLQHMANPTTNLVVTARAGSGKTTTIIGGVAKMPAGEKLLCAFNKDVARDLQSRAPYGVDVKTLHSLGFSTVKLHLGNEINVDANKGKTIARIVAGNYKRVTKQPADVIRGKFVLRADDVWGDLNYNLFRLVGFVKNCQPASQAELNNLVESFGVVNEIVPLDDWTKMVRECTKRAAQELESVDFDDMIYLPRKLNLMPWPQQYVLVDECQDMNRAQLWLAQQALRQDGRMIIIGDERQAIYRWRGADPEAMSRMTRELAATTLPLSVTYRCPIAVVEHVKKSVSGLDDLQPRPGAPRGRVEYRSTADLLGPYGARPGDFVLSRLNAPLVGLAIHYMKHGIPVVVSGKDIGRGLIELVERSRTSTTAELRGWLSDFKLAEMERLTAADQMEHFADVCDRIEAVQAVADMCATVPEVARMFESMYADESPYGAITCSTVHRAKGRERDRVWLLDWSFYDRGQSEEGDNIYYVAATRAKKDLFLVGQPTRKDGVRVAHDGSLSINDDAGHIQEYDYTS